MIQSAMMFALGFFVSGLLWLAFSVALVRRARRLTERRLLAGIATRRAEFDTRTRRVARPPRRADAPAGARGEPRARHGDRPPARSRREGARPRKPSAPSLPRARTILQDIEQRLTERARPRPGSGAAACRGRRGAARHAACAASWRASGAPSPRKASTRSSVFADQRRMELTALRRRTTRCAPRSASRRPNRCRSSSRTRGRCRAAALLPEARAGADRAADAAAASCRCRTRARQMARGIAGQVRRGGCRGGARPAAPRRRRPRRSLPAASGALRHCRAAPAGRRARRAKATSASSSRCAWCRPRRRPAGIAAKANAGGRGGRGERASSRRWRKSGR